MSDKVKLLYISTAIQIGFVLIAILSLAFAQAINATLSLMVVLSVLGAGFVIELIVVSVIWCYLHFSKGTLDDVSDGVRHAGSQMLKRAKSISDAVTDNVAEGKPARDDGDAGSGKEADHERA